MSGKLYDDPETTMKELRKIAGVHEFVHFLAIVYVATVTGTASLRSQLLDRLRRTVDKFPGASLLTLYATLTSKVKIEKPPAELTDSHFRLGYEGDTPDYESLFLHLMFSKEKQSQFNSFIEAVDNDKAAQVLVTTLTKAAKDKDAPVRIALGQLLEWVHVYM